MPKSNMTVKIVMPKGKRGRKRRSYSRRPRGMGYKTHGVQYIPRSAETAAAFGRTWRSATAEQQAARSTAHYYGQGKYGLRRTLGRFAKRNHLGQRALDAGMSYAGGGMYTGSGSYDGGGSTNDLISGGDVSSIPSFSTGGDETGTLTISHKEYIRDIYGNPETVSFANQGIDLNPGLEESFPWLSQIAQNFEEYEFQQLIFTYRSTIADVSSANGQVGTIMAVTNYNANEAIFPNKSQMMGYAHCMSEKTTNALLHGVECDPDKLAGSAGKYVRSQGIDPHQDIKTYDHGKFQLAIANTPNALADNTIGEMWVSYTVSLRKPKYHTKEGFGISRDVFRQETPNGTAWIPTTAGFMNGLPVKGIHNSIGVDITQTTAGFLLTFPAHYAGNLETTIRMANNSGAHFVQAGTLNPCIKPTIAGNVQYLEDIVGTVEASADGVGYHVGCNDGQQVVYTIHTRVDIASNAIDNTLLLVVDPVIMAATTELTTCAVEVAEYNSTFGSNLDPQPIYVNSRGAVVD